MTTLTAAIHGWFESTSTGCTHFDIGHGPYAMCEDPDIGVPIHALPAIIEAALTVDVVVAAINTAQPQPGDIALGHDLRPLAGRLRAALTRRPEATHD